MLHIHLSVIYLNYGANIDIRMERIVFEWYIKDYKLENYGWILQPEYVPRKMNKTKQTVFDNIVEFKLTRTNCPGDESCVDTLQ